MRGAELPATLLGVVVSHEREGVISQSHPRRQHVYHGCMREVEHSDRVVSSRARFHCTIQAQQIIRSVSHLRISIFKLIAFLIQGGADGSAGFEIPVDLNDTRLK